MIRKLGVILFVVVLFAGCSQQGTEQKATELTLAELTANTGEYVGKVVQVSGTVNHVCRHGGKKMFIAGEAAGQRFKINASADVGSFDIALEGSDVQVVGLVEEQRVDAAYLDEWESTACSTEKEAAMANTHDHGDGHDHSHDSELTETQKKTLNNINSLRGKLEASGKGHLSFYSMKCKSFQEVS